MTVVIHIGRRVPRSWFRAGVNKLQGIISFQEHIWTIVKQSFNLAKKKANSSNTGIKFVITSDDENEDLNYKIEWMKIMIQGTEKQEEEEYNEALKMYEPFATVFKKDMKTDDRLKEHIKTKVLTIEKVDEAYKKGYGVVSDNNISNKLLEMGIITHIEWVRDFNDR
jgi:hypothetical protein